METSDTQHPFNDVKPASVPITEGILDGIVDEEHGSDQYESNSSDGEDSEKQLTIADTQTDEQEKWPVKPDLHEDETQQAEFEEIPITHEKITYKEIKDKEVEEENGFKLIQAPIIKLNGNHSLSLNEEDTCSSTTSSTSSHNLVIDHPLAEEQPPTNVQENNVFEVQKIYESRSLKRKLSSCSNEYPKNKHIHLDATITIPDKNYQEPKFSTLTDEQRDSVCIENSSWKENKNGEPYLLTKPSFPQNVAVQVVSENSTPLTFSQQIHSNKQETGGVGEKEKPPTPNQLYTGTQSIKNIYETIKETTNSPKFVSPSNYGPYPVYSSQSVPSTSIAAEITSLDVKSRSSPHSNQRVPAMTTLKESSQPTWTYGRYITSTGKSLPAPKLNFECFKCKSEVFESFSELRNHHKTCLFKDNQKKVIQNSSATPDLLANTKEKTVALSNPPGPVEPLSAATPKKRFYLCSSCGTYHENWNLFLHIREIHNRHVCLYCIRLFPTAEKLSLHLEIKHDLEQNHFNSEEKLRAVSRSDGNSRFLMCCTCQHVFSEHERFSDHVCSEYIQPCSLCGQKGRHLSNCKANPQKRPKTKRKAKKLEAPLPAIQAGLPTKANNKFSKVPTTVAQFSVSGQLNENKINNNAQIALPSLPVNRHAIPTSSEFSKQNGYSDIPLSGVEVGYTGIKPTSENCNYHSDDSTNMVIDETCSSNNYFNQMPSVNPFKALDERERQEAIQKTAEIKSTLPPDRVPETIPEPKPLIVPKIKLRVPREFQKAVDMAMSSSDSNEEEDHDREDEINEKEQEELSKLSMCVEKSMIEHNPEPYNSSSGDEKESGQEDGNELNSKLDRILKAIEKTQSEIRRTKEKMMRVSPAVVDQSVEEPPNEVTATEAEKSEENMTIATPVQDDVSSPFKPDQYGTPLMEKINSPVEQPSDSVPVPPSIEPVAELENSNISSIIMDENETQEREIYSPTPPPSPNSEWPSPLYKAEDSPTVFQAVSERENLENIEKEYEHAKEQTPETEKLNSSSDLDIDSLQTQEESTMDIEEKSRQTQPSSSPLDIMDFSPINESEKTNNETANTEQEIKPTPQFDDEDEEIEVVHEHVPPADGIEVANDDVLITDLLLDRPIEKFEIIEFVRLCVKAVYSLCLYCNHARRIAVCGHSLVLHLLAHHRFSATVDSITAEELLPSTIVSKLKSFLPELEEHYFNMESYSTLAVRDNAMGTDFNERVFECFQCRFSTRMHKDLYLHNRKMHLKTAILCFMCRANFFSFSEILCHICPGAPNKVTTFDIKFRCCLCDVDKIPSPFRLMVHLRKKHCACDICLEDCHVQSKLSSHVWKHKLHHLCYRCGIAYRNKMDITKHLFWKHGTESIICKRCLQKRWRHVYHFCVPPALFSCDACSLCFSKATYLKVHQREHTGDFRYPCTEDNCEEKFVSRKLLLKHSVIHAPPLEIKTEEETKEIEQENKDQQDSNIKERDAVTQEFKPLPVELTDVKEDEKKSDEKKCEELDVGSKRKKKRSRNKESLEDLNLIAPNLSESDSSSESDSERYKTEDKESVVPNVMLSPQSEDEKEDDRPETDEKDTGKIMDIWENFKTFQASQQSKKDDDESFTESDYPTPILHVASSDHDYCAMYKIRPRMVIEDRSAELIEDPDPTDVVSDTESKVNDLMKINDSLSPTKKKRKSTGSHSSSSGSSSDSSSRSSCSCKTNCSCSSSSSESGSSSSSDDSDSSTSEGRRRVAKRREEKAERNRVKTEISQNTTKSENVDVGEILDKQETLVPVIVKEKPVFIETDLETAESETDEEFYDEHPQKLASEILAEKRLQLQEQMRLSPSHNFDIMENSRPSTPSLPEEMIKEKKVKLKKRKRDRKSSCKSLAVPPIKLNLSINKVEILNNEPAVLDQTAMQVSEQDLIPSYDLVASPGVAEPPVAQQPTPTTPAIQNHTVKPVPFFHCRMSEGSSCSDADSSLKRSKRARRPNKFYGYTSDDENIPGTPLVIGTRTFKPQPPPQLTWRKEDLPAPSKSILLNKQVRTPKTPAGQKGQIKKRLHQKTISAKKKLHRLPPIPTLKIRPPKLDQPVEIVAISLPPPPPLVAPHKSYSSSRDESDDTDSTDDDLELPETKTVSNTSEIPPAWNPPLAPVIREPTLPPPPPPPQASMFNQKIPPALLPNPDLATIQYFKRNNIRYPIAPPAGARKAREGESVYCYCRCPYDEVSEMIACDGENCLIEWFHFECVGIMVAPQGKWFCAECRPKYSNELYPQLS